MLIIKKWGAPALLLVVLTGVLAGCTPRGTKALLNGKKMIEAGRYEEAVQELQLASALIGTNAIVWHQLGLAYQYTGRGTNAEQAYAKALTLDRNLAEAHFNLAMLRMEEQRYDAARSALIAYTALRPTAIAGWVKLGTVQLRLREAAAAEKSFQEALRLDRQNPEALNGLGVIATYRRDFRTAVARFTEALEADAEFAAAALNLAVVNHTLNNRPVALERYREFLNLAGPSRETEAVRAIVASLERELTPASTATTSSAAQAPAVAAVRNTSPPPAVRAEPQTPPERPVSTTPPVRDVRVAQEPSVRPPPEPISPARTATASTRPENQRTAPEPVRTNASASRDGLLTRMNPLRVFRNDSTNARPRRDTTPLPPREAVSEPAPQTRTYPRYRYSNPARGAVGDTASAQSLFAQGVRAHQSGQLKAAVEAYREATRLNPAYFETFYNLGLALSQSGSVSQALTAYESALAIRPDSLDARFNFAVTLRQANYIPDAIRELENVLGRYPREARVHILLGNIYAQALRQNATAREHYTKALELDSRHPQAASIRQWLGSH